MTTYRTRKRTPAFIVTGAVAGFAGVILFHVGAATPAAAGSLGTSAGPSARATPTGSAGPRPGGKKAHHPAGHAGHSAAGTGGTRSATGSKVNFGYGTIAVRVTVSGHSITKVSVASLSTLEPTSQQICAQAIPMLSHEVLSVHSAAINGISGATYTSEGYYRSLESALHQLHV